MWALLLYLGSTYCCFLCWWVLSSSRFTGVHNSHLILYVISGRAKAKYYKTVGEYSIGFKVPTSREDVMLQPGDSPQRGIYDGVQNSGCPGNIKNMGCPHPHRSELGDGTHGTGPLRVVLHSNSFANNHRNGHLTYL